VGLMDVSSVRKVLEMTMTIASGCLLGNFCVFFYHACLDLRVPKPRVVVSRPQWVVCVVTLCGPCVYTCASRREAERLFGKLHSRRVLVDTRKGPTRVSVWTYSWRERAWSGAPRWADRAIRAEVAWWLV
jgi:hypothetical protein